jgi:hypothetical protein
VLREETAEAQEAEERLCNEKIARRLDRWPKVVW